MPARETRATLPRSAVRLVHFQAPGERESLPRSRVYRGLPFESHCHRRCLESRRGSLFHLSKPASRGDIRNVNLGEVDEVPLSLSLSLSLTRNPPVDEVPCLFYFLPRLATPTATALR